MRLNTYLNFNGNCKEAFEFYAKRLGGKITALYTYGDSPMKGYAPDDAIMHVRLDVGDQVLMGSDGFGEHVETPQGFSTSIAVEDPAEAERLYAELSDGAKTIVMPLQETFWSSRFAMFVDRFGTPWMINCGKDF